jgi:hypothetical protein
MDLPQNGGLRLVHPPYALFKHVFVVITDDEAHPSET